MRKKFSYISIIFFFFSFINLFFTPGILLTLQNSWNNSDMLFPFSIYQGMMDQSSHPDWVFGGNTPFLDVLVGLLFWLPTHNIQLTFIFFAIFQPVLVCLCLLFLITCMIGKNWQLFSLVFIFAAVPILSYSFGSLSFVHHLFTWYLHISTLCLSLIVLGFTIQYTSHLSEKKMFSGSLAGISAVTSFAILSDPIFLPQFIAPIIILLISMILLGVITFRRGVIAGLVILYSSAGGLAIYQLPRLWGSDRIILYGSYMKPGLEKVFENWPIFLSNISSILDGHLWILWVWILFYLLCAVSALLTIWKHHKSQYGIIRKKLLMLTCFLLIQMVTSIGAALISNDPSIRYFQPIVYLPLFWGWPFLLIGRPGWIRKLSSKQMGLAGYTGLSIAAVILAINISGNVQNTLPDPGNYYPEFIQCMDENTTRLGIKRGIAHYWQARPITLLSKNDLKVVQVTPDLKPFRILNNSDGYKEEIDFVVIDHSPDTWNRSWNWIDSEIVIQRFGEPASTFTCFESDIWVYNRSSDNHFRRQFLDIRVGEK